MNYKLYKNSQKKAHQKKIEYPKLYMNLKIEGIPSQKQFKGMND